MGLRKVYGIDTGTDTIKIYSQSKDKTFVETNMIALRKKERKVIAVGAEAYGMFEKTPADIEVSSPMAFGMIADIPKMEYVLYRMLKKNDRPRRSVGSVIYFAVPMDLPQLKKQAYNTIVNSGRMHRSRVRIVEKPIADAIAMELSIEKNRGSMIMNIGAQSAEMSILADGRVIISRVIPIGGDQIDQAICEEIRRTAKLQIGTKTAERLKLVMGNAYAAQTDSRKVYGIDSLSGLPREEVVTSEVVHAAIVRTLDAIGEEMKTFLERIPPQIVYEIMREGIHLTGGSTRLPGIDRYLSEYLEYKIVLSPLYEQCTVTGLKKIVSDRYLQKWALPMKQRKL